MPVMMAKKYTNFVAYIVSIFMQKDNHFISL